MAPKTLGQSGRGRHIHSTFPLGAISALTSPSARKPYSAIGGNGLRSRLSSTSGTRLKVLNQLASVITLPGVRGFSLRVLTVQPYQHVDELASDRSAGQDLGQLRKVDQPVGIP